MKIRIYLETNVHYRLMHKDTHEPYHPTYDDYYYVDTHGTLIYHDAEGPHIACITLNDMADKYFAVINKRMTLDETMLYLQQPNTKVKGTADGFLYQLNGTHLVNNAHKNVYTPVPLTVQSFLTLTLQHYIKVVDKHA